MGKTDPKRALTIAGSDSGGGAGIQADLKTFTALGVYGASVVTAVTAQNANEVRAIHTIPSDVVGHQIDSVVQDIGIDAVKSGMLLNREIVEIVADAISKIDQPIYVLDPVMISESGTRLLETEATEAMIRRLIPLAHVVTPNIPEAEVITSRTIKRAEDMRDAAKHVHGLGADYVLIKGGHMESSEATDVLFDGTHFQTFSIERIEGANPHGTGCTFSAAITAYLAKGIEVPEAVDNAKAYITGAIFAGFAVGQGPGLLNHFWQGAQESSNNPTPSKPIG